MDKIGIVVKVADGRSWVKLGAPDGGTQGPNPIEGPAVVVEVPGGGAVGDRVRVEVASPAAAGDALRVYALLLGGLLAGAGVGRVLVEIDGVAGRLAGLAGALSPLVTGDNLALAGGLLGLVAGWFAAGALLGRLGRGSGNTGKILEVLAPAPDRPDDSEGEG